VYQMQSQEPDLDQMEGFTMRTSLILLAMGVAALVTAIALAVPATADQLVGPGSAAISATTALWSGGTVPLVLTKGMGSHMGHSYGGSPYLYGSPFIYSTPGVPIDQPICTWNGYNWVCYSPDGRRL
jgi:hypothetical protein